MSKCARVIEVERFIACLRGQVAAGPLRARPGPAPSPRVAERLAGQCELSCGELEVVPPGRLGIEHMRKRGHDVVRVHALRLRCGEDLRCCVELAPRPRRIRDSIELRRECKGCCHAPCEVRRQRLPGTVAREGGAVTQVEVRRAGERVVTLRQAPEVVVAVEGPGLVPGADPDLDEHHTVPTVPGLREPAQPEPALGGERRRCSAAKRALRRQ